MSLKKTMNSDILLSELVLCAGCGASETSVDNNLLPAKLDIVKSEDDWKEKQMMFRRENTIKETKRNERSGSVRQVFNDTD